jgi:hypothetical protein
MRTGADARSSGSAESRTIGVKAASRRSGQPKIEGGSRDARLRAAVILDVLAGLCSPAEAARAVGISLPRYYALESRLLGQLVSACEDQPRGKRVGPEKQIAELEREVERLRRECARKQALVRAVQRTMGITLPERRPLDKRKRPRRPTVRALKAAAVLRATSTSSGSEPSAGSVA